MHDFLDDLDQDESPAKILEAYLAQSPAVKIMFDAITAFPNEPLPRDIEDARAELERAIWDWSAIWHIANHRP